MKDISKLLIGKDRYFLESIADDYFDIYEDNWGSYYDVRGAFEAGAKGKKAFEGVVDVDDNGIVVGIVDEHSHYEKLAIFMAAESKAKIVEKLKENNNGK